MFVGLTVLAVVAMFADAVSVNVDVLVYAVFCVDDVAAEAFVGKTGVLEESKVSDAFAVRAFVAAEVASTVVVVVAVTDVELNIAAERAAKEPEKWKSDEK